MSENDQLRVRYPMLERIVSKASISDNALPYLIENWLRWYARSGAVCKIVETTQDGCSFLYDLAAERLIAAWTFSTGKNTEKRDKYRQREYPMNFGSTYHRGHAIPHSGGGPLDINVVPQLGVINTGRFRKLEIEAVANPGSLYFTHWLYADASEKPAAVEQGLLCPGLSPQVSFLPN
jgi:hypothetical protein